MLAHTTSDPKGVPQRSQARRLQSEVDDRKNDRGLKTGSHDEPTTEKNFSRSITCIHINFSKSQACNLFSVLK
jgi:hypothetical protein